jgi:anti-sigma regulatory factor (Ser/Thr protein kinase)
VTDLLRLRILSDDAAPAAARRAIDLLGTAFGDRIDDVRMAVGELVNNSRVHGRPLEDGTIELVVATRGGVHRVEVSDGGGAGLPVASSDTSPDRLGGRGLALVSRIAARWGYVRGAGTKAWFEVGNASPQPVDPNEAMDRIDQTMATAHPDTVAAAACELLVEIMDIGSVEFYRRGAGGELEIVAAAAAGNASFPARPPDPSPGLAAAVLGGDGGLVSVADGRIRALPVAHGGNRVGALVCSGPPPPYEVPVVVVSHLAAEVGRAHARVAIGRDQGRLVRDLRFLAEASAVLSSSLDYEHTLQRVAQLVVPARADWCTVNLVEPDGAIRRVAAEHRDPAARPRLAELLDRSPHDPDAPTGVPRVIATGEAALFAEVPDRLLEETANDPGYLRSLATWRSGPV